MRGPEFYDDPERFQTYFDHRSRVDNANDAIEEPIFWKLLGDVSGSRAVDLGCGDARIGPKLLARGCRSYQGIDGSDAMIRWASETLKNTPGTCLRLGLEDWSPSPGSADLILSRLALHYIERLDVLFSHVREALAPGGRFIFSVEHPVITSCNRSMEMSAKRSDWIVDDYFVTGARDPAWLGGRVRKYHHTVEDYFSLLQSAGFRVDQLRESKPDVKHFESQEEYQRRTRIPLFLFFAAS